MQAIPLSITAQIDASTASITGVAMTYRLILPDGTDIVRQQDMGKWLLNPNESVGSQVLSACQFLLQSLLDAGFDIT